MIIRSLLKATPLLIFLFCASAFTYTNEYKVTRVYDGDTIAVVENGIRIRLHLVGIDSPETSKGKNKPAQPFNQKSTKYLSWLILNETIEIKSYGIDSYRRILAIVYNQGEDINLKMVKEGYAEVYRGKSPDGFDLTKYESAEKEAREAKKGIWVQGDKYISPFVWRRMNKK